MFVANATAAIKLVADAFHGAAASKSRGRFTYRYHHDAHTSLIGVRELAGRWRCFRDDADVEAWLKKKGRKPSKKYGLFAYPAQSNLTGRRLPLHWAQNPHGYYTLLDAAALLMTKPLDLSNASSCPDFISCSWYKVFGMPDLGALIVKRGPAAEILQRRAFFGGGTVSSVLAGIRHHTIKSKHPHEGLEDGTAAFHSILMLGISMKRHHELYGGLDRIGKHTGALGWALHKMLSEMRHVNRAKVVEFYSTPEYLDTNRQGPVLSFNLKDMHGGYIGFLEVEKRASEENIHIRTGANCNPGGVARYCGFNESELKKLFLMGGKACGDDKDLIWGKPAGVVRVSLGAMSTWDDIRIFAEFVNRLWVAPVRDYPEKAGDQDD